MENSGSIQHKKSMAALWARHRRLWLFLLWAVAVLALSASFAAGRVQTLSYNPVNGDFQSYNVFRRLLAGQTPYVDFANYIGMAPVVLNLPLLFLGGGDFAASLFVTNFTCCALFCLVALVVLWLITQNLTFSLVASALLPKLVSTGVVATVLGPSAGGYLETLFQNLYTPSNSMRIARIFWPFALVLAFLVFDFFHRKKNGVSYTLEKAPQSGRFCALFGLLCGLGVTWSNDFGLAVAFCGTVLLVLLLAKQRPGARVFCQNLGLYVGMLTGGALCAVLLASGGHPGSWWRFTAGVGQYQYFYFNGTGGRAVLPYIFTNPRLLLCTAPYAAFLVFCLVQLLWGKLGNRLLLGGFLAFCTLAASYAYIVSGSGYNFTEALEGGLWLATLGALGKGALHLLRKWSRRTALALTACLCAVCVLFSGLLVRDVLRPAGPDENCVVVPALGGAVPYPAALQEAAAFTADGEVFSVYATGLEVVKGTFQPTGCDYIIHALGADAQAHYVDTFTAGQYPYVQTMDLSLESWLCVENWYFYREVAAGYERALQTEYSWIWTKRQGPAVEMPGAQLTVEEENGVYTITVTADGDTDFVADVRIAYETEFAGLLSAVLSLGRRAAALTVPDPMAADGQVGCYLPGKSGGWTIPIAVRGGVGKALLYPADHAHLQLKLQEVTLVRQLPDMTLVA